MLPYTEYGTGETTLIFLHFLGGSQREWTESIDPLSRKYRCITIDLPGFGAAADTPGYTVSEMADALLELVAHLQPERYFIVGHSMGGKVTAVAARRLVDDPAQPKLPLGLILITPSPPCVEPMSESRRAHLIEGLGTLTGDPQKDRENAEKFIRANISIPLSSERFERTVDETLRMNRSAFTAWLTSGSNEDWADRVGILHTPTLLLVGEKDGDLGLSVQNKLTLPHFSAGHVIAIDCNHLIPLEEPDSLAAYIGNFLQVF